MSDVTPSSAPTPSSGAPSPKGSSTSTGSAPTTSAPKSATPNPQTAMPKGPSLADQVKKPEAHIQQLSEPPKPPQKIKIPMKVDGREWEEEVTEADIRARWQKEYAAEKRMQEAAEIRKRWQAAVEFGKKDPARAMKDLFGLDLDEIAEQRLQAKFEEAILPEHERKTQALQKELEALKAEKQEAASKAEAEARKKYEDQVWQETEGKFLGSLEKLGFDKSTGKFVLPLMADIAEANLEANIGLDEDMIAHETTKRLKNLNGQILKGMKGDSLLQYLGDEVVDAVLSAKLEKMKLKPIAPPPPAPPKPPAPPSDEPKKRISPTEFRRKHLFGLK